jgi:DNA-directed RNA polymerase specialized sigma24 family protein
VTEVELERMLERIRAISDDEKRFAKAQELLRLVERLNPVAAEIRNGAALALHESHGWTYERIGARFKLKKSAVQRIIDNARGKSRPKRKRG